jgi:hypothetical protein
MKRSLLFFLVPFSFFLVAARGDAGWILTTADFKTQPVDFQSMDKTSLRFIPFEPGAKTATVPFEQFLQIDRSGGSREPAGRFTLLLLSGDRLLGEPISFKDEQIIWKNATLGELKVPLKEARALRRTGRNSDAADQTRTEDFVQMANGDSVKGIVTDIADGKVKVNSGGNDVLLGLDAVDWIGFAATAKPAPPQAGFRVRLLDASLLTAASVEVDGANATLRLSAQDQRVLPLAAISAIEQANGPVGWLSSRAPEQAVQIPYTASTPRPTRMDLSVDGKPIQFGGKTYSRGIGVHSYSKLDYALDGQWEAFRTQYAISADERRPYADVTVRIKLDGKVVHERKNFKAETLSPAVLIDLPKTAKLLTLEVDYGAVMDAQDSFNWIEPALLRKKPAAPATSPATSPAR